MRPVLGDPAPPIALPTLDGPVWRSEQHRGSLVVVIFHRHIH
ncbi:MAG: hypothetical protein AAGA42_15180 [Actinomycetota bacterium]